MSGHARYDFSYLSPAEQETLNRAAATLGEEAVMGLISRDKEIQGKRLQGLAALLKQAADTGVDEAVQALTSGGQANQPKQATLQVNHLKPLKVSLGTFDGKSGEKLLLWCDEMEMGFEARLLTDERHKVITALAQLRGSARDWSRIALRADPKAFPDWKSLKADLCKTFLPPDLEHRNRSKFLGCKQGKRSLLAYIQELRALAAGCITHPLSEEVKVTVLMQNLNKGAPRTQLFRVRPTSFEEAVQVVMAEDLSLTAANSNYYSSTSTRYDDNEPEPMDIGQVETVSNTASRNSNKNVTCHRCGKPGHYARNCRAPTPQASASLNNTARSQRGRGRRKTRSPGSSQGNGNSQ
jgi:hypothetical protein